MTRNIRDGNGNGNGNGNSAPRLSEEVQAAEATAHIAQQMHAAKLYGKTNAAATLIVDQQRALVQQYEASYKDMVIYVSYDLYQCLIAAVNNPLVYATAERDRNWTVRAFVHTRVPGTNRPILLFDSVPVQSVLNVTDDYVRVALVARGVA